MTPRPLRIFLGAFGQPGHAFPMLALGARLVERGHSVTFETWGRWREPVQTAGMTFVAAPEYPVFPTMERPLKPYEAVVRATAETRRAVVEQAPDIVVHDILTLAPAMAGELEGIPVATLVPHLYPVAAPGFPPYATGARLPAYARAGVSSTRPAGAWACRPSSVSTAGSAPSSASSPPFPSSSTRADGRTTST
jgi:UDP:flavonoid glycosyltransferase YjiC (YdhE family)